MGYKVEKEVSSKGTLTPTPPDGKPPVSLFVVEDASHPRRLGRTIPAAI